MKNLTKKAPIIAFGCLIIAVFSGIYLRNVNEPLNTLTECDITNDACNTMVLGERFSVKFEQTPVTEEELFIRFEKPSNLNIIGAWIEGANMYMGKTPVMFENQSNDDLGVTFLGSCNLNKMLWHLHIEIKKDASDDTASLVIPFTTYIE